MQALLALFPSSLLYEQECSLQYSGNAVESLPIYIYLALSNRSEMEKYSPGVQTLYLSVV